MTIEEYEFAGEDDKTLCGVAVEGLPATVEQLNEFAGIRRSWCIVELAARVEGNTSLCGVADDKADLGLVGQCHECLILSIGV